MVVATATQNDRGAIIFGGSLRIPPGITDLESFRQWARSEDFPEHGEIAWLGGVLWVDLEMERVYTHNHVKTEITSVLVGIAKQVGLGYVFSDGMRFGHPVANVSAEPDAMFVSYETFEIGAIREVLGVQGEAIELEGSPDMVLEVVSDSSVDKDTNRLMNLYFQAGIKEYWLVDVRGEGVEFEIYKPGSKGFTATRHQGGKVRSNVFGHSFQLTRDTDKRGNPRFTLSVF